MENILLAEIYLKLFWHTNKNIFQVESITCMCDNHDTVNEMLAIKVKNEEIMPPIIDNTYRG